MRNFFVQAVALLVLPLVSCTATTAAEPPNILFIIADDASRHFGEAYHCRWARTPNIDRLAAAGVVFDNAYTPTSKCAPSRAAILTGRNPWQLEEAANHQPYFPAKFTAFTEVLQQAGVYTGGAGKTWGPGTAQLSDGKARDFGLTKARGRKAGGSPGDGLAAFLANRPHGKPFFYWFGSANPHRAYPPDSGLAAGKKTTDIDRVPAYWPDNDIIRRDMLDYAVEVEAFDAEVGSLLQALEAAGEDRNTLVIVTSDHGMPFPRVKGHTFDDAHRIPFVARWPAGIAAAGRRVREFISFIDLAPTMLELQQVASTDSPMAAITGRSFVNLLTNTPGPERPFVIIGRERNDVQCRPGTPAGLGYPARAIRFDRFLYVHNFEPDRWPCGNPEIGFSDTDASPTKTFAETSGIDSPWWQHAFGKRPAEQLFDIETDPDCVNNLAANPDFRQQTDVMREQLMNELRQQQDPRVLGSGAVFDNYLSPRATGAGARKE